MPDRFQVGITRYEPADRDKLAAFRDERFGPGTRQSDRARHRWLFETNPCNGDDGPAIWLCRRDGRLVGQQAEIPFDLQIGRDERRATWAVDLMVDPAWRLRGVGPALIAAQARGKRITAGLNLSTQGFAAYTKLGWTDLGIVPVYVRPLDARRALRKAPGPRLVRKIAPLAGPAWRVLDDILGWTSRLAGLRLVPVDRFDQRSDDVWTAAADHYPVLARRDRAAVRWRLDERPDRDRLARYYLVRRGRTLGYVVLRHTSWDGDPAAVVVDYLAPPRWVTPLLLAAGRAARREGAVAMMVKTRNHPADRRLRTAGFVRRNQVNDPPIRLMVRCDDEAGICALVQAPESWFVTSADSDLEHATRPDDAGR